MADLDQEPKDRERSLAPLKQRFERRRGELKRQREPLMPVYRELSDYFEPRRGRFLSSDINKAPKKAVKVINNVGQIARRTLAAGMMAGLTSPARPWFKLTIADQDLAEFGQVRVWLDDVERRMRAVFNQTNLYDTLLVHYREMGVFGTACMLGLDDFDEVTRFHNFTVGEYYLAADHRGEVNAFYRDVPVTVLQLVTQFGLDAVSNTVRKLYDEGRYHGFVEVRHAVEPNEDRDVDRADNLNMPFLSVYWEAGEGREDKFLKRSGFERFPAYATRWDVLPPEVYGAGPGMEALGDNKALQVEEKRKAQAIDKMSDPPMKGPPSLKKQYASVLPGDLTYVDETQGAFVPAYQVNPRIAELMQDIATIENRINRAFYVDLFLMLASTDRRQITAREVAERHEEKLLMLGPVSQRTNHALLKPLIDNTFQRMWEAGLIAPPPPELQGQELGVEFISMLAQAQQVVGMQAIQSVAGYVGSLAPVFPQVIDKFNADQSVDAFADAVGAPSSIIVADEEVEAKRAAAAEQAQQAQMAALAEQVAQGAETLSRTDTSSDNLLTRIIDQVGGGQ